MNRVRTICRSLALPIVLGLVTLSTPTLHAAPAGQAGKQTGGTGRQGDGQPLRVTVLLHGKPFASAHIVIATGDGTVVLRGLTHANGVFTTNSLNQGTYIVTATTPHTMATTPVSIVTSTDPALVSLTLQPKTPPAP